MVGHSNTRTYNNEPVQDTLSAVSGEFPVLPVALLFSILTGGQRVRRMSL